MYKENTKHISVKVALWIYEKEECVKHLFSNGNLNILLWFGCAEDSHEFTTLEWHQEKYQWQHQGQY